METVSINVFSFSELSEWAKQTAIENHREYLYENGPAWQKENRETLEAFEAIFPIKAKDWEYGDRNYINYRLDTMDYDEISGLSGVRLLKYLVNNYWNYLYKGKFYSTDGRYENGKYTYKSRHSKCQFECCCPLTGHCLDYDILEPIMNFMKKPDSTTFEQLLYECLQSLVYACSRDWEDEISDERIAESIEANEYRFTEDGQLY